MRRSDNHLNGLIGSRLRVRADPLPGEEVVQQELGLLAFPDVWAAPLGCGDGRPVDLIELIAAGVERTAVSGAAGGRVKRGGPPHEAGTRQCACDRPLKRRERWVRAIA